MLTRLLLFSPKTQIAFVVPWSTGCNPSQWPIVEFIDKDHHDLYDFYQSQMIFMNVRIFRGKMVIFQTRKPLSCCTFSAQTQMVLMGSDALIPLLNSNKGICRKCTFFYLTIHFLLQMIYAISAQIYNFETIQLNNKTTLTYDWQQISKALLHQKPKTLRTHASTQYIQKKEKIDNNVPIIHESRVRILFGAVPFSEAEVRTGRPRRI